MDPNEEEVANAGQPEEKKGALSKAQKKKAKAKAKVEEPKPEAATTEAAEEEDKHEEKGGAKGKKGKKGAAPRAAIAKLAQEKLKAKQEEEERIRLEEERIRKEEEEAERIRLEEERVKREAEELKKKQKKDKIDQLKAAGKWKTPKQKAEEEAARMRRQQLIDQGLIKADSEDEEEDDGQKKQKTMIVRNKKKNKKKEAQQTEETNANKDQNNDQADTNAEQETQDTTKIIQQLDVTNSTIQQEQPDEEEDVIDDWENADLEDMAKKITKKEATSGPKHLKDEEIEEDKHDHKEQQKVSQPVKKQVKVKEEESKGPNNIFDQTEESQSALKKEKRMAEIRAKLEQREKDKEMRLKNKIAAKGKLRMPIICILGHVDTGKTLILDKLRRTNVQAGEAGGITQQIGATYFPEEALREHLGRMKGRIDLDLQIPGYLIIDTPGHESFTNLRSRGSNLCDMAILVVDIMHGLEKQTLESLQLLKNKKTPFVVALNKIDRMYGWKSKEYNNVRDALESQNHNAQVEFKDRLNKTILAFAEEGINTALYWENQDPLEYVSFCPTSAITGEGLPDLMIYISQMCQTYQRNQLKEKDEFECSVLEVKVIEGLGTTIDIILVNGVLNVGDTIVISGFNGPIVTTIRALLTPQPLKEMRVKGEYIHHQSIKGSMGIKISANGLENAIAGSELFRANNEEEVEEYKAQIADDLVDIMDKYVDKTKHGVCVQASTLGSLEALLEFLKTMKIPVTAINIGPVHKKDVLKAMKSIAGEHTEKEYATILAFDVKVTPEAQEFADENGITIFTANIIYNLFDAFEIYVKKCRDERKTDEGSKAVFPCLLEIVKGAIFNSKNPIIIGVTVKAGILKIGTPLCIPDKGNLKIGHVESIELNGKPVQRAQSKHGSVAVKIAGESQIMVGRHFDDTSQIVSILSRDSIDALKTYFKDELSNDDWKLVIQLKKMFGIP